MAPRSARLSSLLCLGLLACGGGMDPEVGPDSGPADPGTGMQDDAVTLTLQDVESSTEWLSVPVRGQGPAGGVLRYTSTQAGQSSENIGHDGSFCIDVRLEADVLNTIVFEAVSPTGALSEPIMVEVMQTGVPESDEEDIDSGDGLYENVALGATEYDIHASFEEGSFDAVVDGETETQATILNNTHIIFVQDFLTFALPDKKRVESVIVESTEDCPLEKFEVYLTDAEEPGPLYTYDVISLDDNVKLGPEWVRVASVEDAADNPRAEVNLGAADATWVGIEFKSHDCGNRIGPVHTGPGRHEISEIEVLALKDGTEDPDFGGGPRCSRSGDGETPEE